MHDTDADQRLRFARRLDATPQDYRLQSVSIAMEACGGVVTTEGEVYKVAFLGVETTSRRNIEDAIHAWITRVLREFQVMESK